MTSQIQPSDHAIKSAAATATANPVNQKDVKLKDRIHLFEGLSSATAGAAVDRNTSCNNSSSSDQELVANGLAKRWTQFETFSNNVENNNIPPSSKGRGAGMANAVPGPSRRAELKDDKQKPIGHRVNKTPSSTGTAEGSPATKVDDVEQSVQKRGQSVVYIEGTPVTMRTDRARKGSKDFVSNQSCVSLMVNNFEKRRDAGDAPSRLTSPRLLKEVAGLDVPIRNVKRRSAELNQLHDETRVQRSKMEGDVESTMQRRRSKTLPPVDAKERAKLLAPFKPKRTFEHDVYEETKKLITNAEPSQLPPSERRDVPLAADAPNVVPTSSGPNDPTGKKTTPDHKWKELPPIPNILPYRVDKKATPSSPRHSAPVTLDVLPDTAPKERPHSAVFFNLNLPGKIAKTPPKHRRSLSNEAIDTVTNPSYDLQSSTRKSEYAEPVAMTTLQPPPSSMSNMKRAVSDTSLFITTEKREAVVDSEGYSVPGSHLWKKPLPKPKGFHGRVESWKSAPMPPVRKYEPSKIISCHTFDLQEDEDEFCNVELNRNRKHSPKPKHTYTEPGTVLGPLGDEELLPGRQPVRHQSRFVTMRRKINDAFRRPKNHREGKYDDDRISVASGDSDTDVNEEVMSKRLRHAKFVKQRSSVYCNPERYRQSVKDSKLYEYLVVVSLKYDEETRRYQPFETSRYPAELSASQNDKLRAIPHFCFPDAFKWAPVEKYESESYSFVLTSMDGSRLYGYNRRLLPPGDKPRLPEVYCIITPVSCRLLFTQLLDEIERRRMVSRSASEKLIREARTRPVPPPGGSMNIMQMNDDGQRLSTMTPLVLQRPKDSRLEHVDFDCLFSSLRIGQVIQIFASLLFERRVIMCSSKLSTLSKCSQAVAALLYPFAWQHVYVPVLPEKLVDMSCSPTPYIMGMLSLSIPKLDELPLDEVLIVDLDSKDFYTLVGDEDTIIPKKLSQALERALSVIISYSFVENAESEEASSSEDQEAKNRAISEAFIRYFVETCGHYTNHFSSKYDGNLKFDRDGFIQAVTSRSIRRFLEVFTESQMFSLFIQEKETEVEGFAQGLFETRVREWEAECKINANKFGAKVKKIGRAVKDISRERGQKIADTAKDVRIRVKANLDSKV